MVKYDLNLDSIFSSLSDPTRRDILQRVADRELTVGEIAQPYQLSLAAVSKHLKVLEHSQLIVKRRKGKKQLVKLSPLALKNAAHYLQEYQALWENRLDSLAQFLNTN
ncbi:MAG: winged helix-turn-helix transcriptional regulator [Candidatus Abawacabacteria bacterium]|nr:winged helix-turn-helix transcriptional regulator [Candidatus Abawacabacteria bacterium]